MHIFKFGGASVKDADAIRNLESIIQKFNPGHLIVVVSAMGKTTNLLEGILKQAINGDDYSRNWIEITKFHDTISNELLGHLSESYIRFQHELEHELSGVYEKKWIETYDKIVPFGELMSTAIISEYLQKNQPTQWMDARDFIKTDEFHTEANIKWDITCKLVKSKLLSISDRIVLTQGFIGSNESNETTTLGREGSDFTGAVIAHCLDAESFTVWKDVPGILNADPKLKSNTEQFEQLSYREVTEMTYYGAKVIHPKTLKPLAQKNIPLIVRSFIDHNLAGTQIASKNSHQKLPVFVFKKNQLLITAEVKDHSFMNEEKLAVILDTLNRLNVKINLMQNSALTFSFCMDNKLHKLQPIIESLSPQFEVTYNRPLKLTTIQNYSETAIRELPEMGEVLLAQKTRNTYQVLHR